MFIPRTKDGRLIRTLRQKEEEIRTVVGHSVKLVERPGKSIKNLLWTADPFGGGSMCGRGLCLLYSRRRR